jgi:hypothetical protein
MSVKEAVKKLFETHEKNMRNFLISEGVIKKKESVELTFSELQQKIQKYRTRLKKSKCKDIKPTA